MDSVPEAIEQILRLVLGMAAGLAIGWQRTVRHKTVGIRTFGIVGLGTAAIAGVFSETLHPDAASRVTVPGPGIDREPVVGTQATQRDVTVETVRVRCGE